MNLGGGGCSELRSCHCTYFSLGNRAKLRFKKKERGWVWWLIPAIWVLREAEVGGSLGPRSLRSAWVTQRDSEGRKAGREENLIAQV